MNKKMQEKILDTKVEKALDKMLSEGLVTKNEKGEYNLTDKGREYINSLSKNNTNIN